MESQIIEYKQSWRDEFLKEICGFANAQGGTLYIGLDDKGNAVGLQHAKKLLEDIPNQSVMTMGVMPNVNLLNKDGKEYISKKLNLLNNRFHIKANIIIALVLLYKNLTVLLCKTFYCVR